MGVGYFSAYSPYILIFVVVHLLLSLADHCFDAVSSSCKHLFFIDFTHVNT